MANGFSDRLTGLLGNPAFNFGIGLLSQSGPSTTPVSLGQALATGAQFASQAQRQKLENDLIRDQLLTQTRRRKALAGLPSLLDPSQLTPLSPEGRQQQLTASLLDIAPEQAVKSLLAPTQRLTATARDAQFLANPNIPDATKQIFRDLKQEGALSQQIKDQAALLQAQVAQGQLRKQDADLIEKEENQRIIKGTADRTSLRALQALDRMDVINDLLENTFAQTGVAASERGSISSVLGAIGRAFGENSEQFVTTGALLNEFEQLSNSLVLGEVAKNAAQGGIRGTVAIQRVIEGAKPNIRVQPGANRAAIKKFRESFQDFRAINEFASSVLAPQSPGLLTLQGDGSQVFRVTDIPGFSELTPKQQTELRSLLSGIPNGG